MYGLCVCFFFLPSLYIIIHCVSPPVPFVVHFDVRFLALHSLSLALSLFFSLSLLGFVCAFFFIVFLLYPVFVGGFFFSLLLSFFYQPCEKRQIFKIRLWIRFTFIHTRTHTRAQTRRRINNK